MGRVVDCGSSGNVRFNLHQREMAAGSIVDDRPVTILVKPP